MIRPCIIGTKFTMTAEVLRQDSTDLLKITEAGGHYTIVQDPISGGIIRQWITADDMVTTGTNEAIISCEARGIINGGIRSAGVGEKWSDAYRATEYVNLKYPKGIILSRRDRITNIKDSTGTSGFIEEDYGNKYTIFEIVGITPVYDALGVHVENFALLHRAEVQA